MKTNPCLLVVIAVLSFGHVISNNNINAQEQEVPDASAKLESSEAVPSALSKKINGQEMQCENCKDGTCEDCKSGACANSEDAAAVSTAGDNSKSQTQFVSTHDQTSILTPKIKGNQAKLNTFRLNSAGEIVTCLAPLNVNRARLQQEDDDDQDELRPKGYIQVYSPEFELIRQFELPFQPTALDIDQSGNFFVAGRGQVCKMASDGEILQMSQAPNLINVDTDAMLEEALEAARERNEQMKEVYGQQIKSFQEQIDEIEAIDEEERTQAQKSTLDMLTMQLKSFEAIVEQSQVEVDRESVEKQLTSGSAVTAIAVTDTDVYVATQANSGSGYEVYRTTLDFKEPVRILKRLRGCCGQMDIHAVADQVFVAENTNFKVGIYDRDGKKVSSFGERLRKDNQGFGSCCNPMNVLCCPNGDILTAESSIGKIKRFNSKGEMTGYVGRARIGGGCKHVAIGHDEKLDRYYVQYEDNNQICVLTPKTEVTKTPDPKLAELSKRLTGGKWRLAGAAEMGEQITGIGVVLESNDDGEMLVTEVLKGTPAAKRLKKGDVILGVGTEQGVVEIKGMDVDKVDQLLQGEPGTRVLLSVRSEANGKVKRRSVTRVRLEKMDGDWVVVDEGDDNFGGFDSDALTKMKVLEFKDDGTLRVEMEEATSYQIPVSGWLATQIEDNTLMLDIEDDDDIIVYRVKVKFTGDDSADISVTYDGLGNEGEFRGFERVKDETLTSDRSK